jgi:hemerythrin-like domain-containing protein
MMIISQGLTQEHGRILQGIEYLSMARDALEKNRHPPKKFFELAVLFFREYADRFHHYKEEYLMFSFLARKKEGAIDLEMGSLRYQHEINRTCIAKIEKSLDGYDMGNEIAVTTLLVNLASFISILRRHIYREDHLFFPMTEIELSEDEKIVLMQQFNQEEKALDMEKILVRSQGLLQEMNDLISES